MVDSTAREHKPGIAVDSIGGPVVDPTKNVLDLVEAGAKFHNASLAAESKYQEGMRNAETRRIDDLAEQRRYYDKQISDILTVQVKTTSELISTQLDKVTTSLAAQITALTKATSDQIAALTNSLTERIGQLERFRWEVGGKSTGSAERKLDMGQLAAWIVAALMAGGLLLSYVSANHQPTVVVPPPAPAASHSGPP